MALRLALAGLLALAALPCQAQQVGGTPAQQTVLEANSASILAAMQQAVSAYSAANGSGTAPPNAMAMGGIYLATQPSLFNGQFETLKLDANGNLVVTIAGASNTGGALPVVEPDAAVYTCTASAVGNFSCTNAAGVTVPSLFPTAGFLEMSILTVASGTGAVVTVKGGDDGSTTPVLMIGRTPEQMTARPFTGNFSLNGGQSYHVALTEAYVQPTLTSLTSGSVTVLVTLLHRQTPGLLPPGIYINPNTSVYCNSNALCTTFVTKYLQGSVNTEGRAPEFRASLSIVPLGGTTVSLSGNAANNVLVKRVSLSCQSSATAAAVTDVQLIKRTAADTGGTSTTYTATPSFGGDPAQTSVLQNYTAAPTVTAAGAFASAKLYIPGSGLTVPPPILDFSLAGNNEKPLWLSGAAQSLDVSFVGAQPNASCDLTIVWDEVLS